MSVIRRVVSGLLARLGFRLTRIGPAAPAMLPDIAEDVKTVIAEAREFTMTSQERLNALCEAIRYLERRGLNGAVVECGVWRGGSMLAAARMLQILGNSSRDLFLFDTFAGMTEPGDADVAIDGRTARDLLEAGQRKEDDGVWAWASLDDVKATMRRSGYPLERIHFVEGMVEETIPSKAPEEIALLRLDTDWFESTAHELRHLIPRLVNGGVLISDDYGHWQGARKAFDEFFATFDPPVLLNRVDYTGRIAIISRR